MQPEQSRTNESAGPDRRPTLRDVAREAGLSVTQTSRALNGHTDVAEATRQRASEAARRIRYTPNLAARRLKNPDTRLHSIGLILDTASQRFSDPFFSALLAALVDEAAAKGYELQLSAPLADEDPVTSYERAIRAKRVDGFVLLRTANDDPRVEYLAGTGLPFVTFGESAHAAEHPSVADSADCLRPAIDHLVALGHRKIACLAEPLGFAVATARHASFVKALADHGIEPDPRYIVIGGYREESGLATTLRLLDLEDPPTAVVAFNDLLAIGAIAAAHSRGVDVPARLSIVGFDDIHAARYTSPQLTTLRHSAAVIGHHLVELLLRNIEDGSSVDHLHVTPELVVRGSTADVTPQASISPALPDR